MQPHVLVILLTKYNRRWRLIREVEGARLLLHGLVVRVLDKVLLTVHGVLLRCELLAGVTLVLVLDLHCDDPLTPLAVLRLEHLADGRAVIVLVHVFAIVELFTDLV